MVPRPKTGMHTHTIATAVSTEDQINDIAESQVLSMNEKLETLPKRLAEKIISLKAYK